VAREVSGARTPTDDVKLRGERYRDILVLPRRSMLKAKRVELVPLYQFNFNSSLIRNHGVGAQINYFLSEVLWLGVEGNYYFPELSNNTTGNYFLSGAQTKVFPATNKLIFTALLDFGYAPVYGKFALFNKWVVHWESYVTLGVGAFMSEAIPFDPVNNPSFKNISAVFQVGLGNRLFLTKWLALNTFLKLYGYPDVFEPVANSAAFTRDAGCSTYFTGLTRGTEAFENAFAQCRQDNGTRSLSLDVVFGVGLSFMLPPSFEYKQPR